MATKKTTCCMPGCGNQPKAKWLCQTHYRHLSLFPDIAAEWPTVPEGKPTPADTAALAAAWEKRDTSSPVVAAPEPPEASKAVGRLVDMLTKERDTAREKAARLEDACRQWEETNRLQRGQIERLQADQEAERKAAAKLATEHERLRGEHEALAAERDQLATEHEALTAELKQAHEDVDTITRLVADLAVGLVGPQMADKTTSGQLRGLHELVQKLRIRIADAEGELGRFKRGEMGPQKSQRDPDGPDLVDPTAALLLLDFARDLAGEVDEELARAVYHAIVGAQGALREQAADGGVPR